MRRTLRERFFRKVDIDGPVQRSELGPCWTWFGAHAVAGYGYMRVAGRIVRATEVSLRLAGVFGKGHTLHSCDNPSCVNPKHLRYGTQKENLEDMVRRGRAHCKLTTKQVAEIRRLVQRREPHLKVAKRFGVAKSLVWAIVHGKTRVLA